jgi:hypothetical protein
MLEIRSDKKLCLEVSISDPPEIQEYVDGGYAMILPTPPGTIIVNMDGGDLSWLQEELFTIVIGRAMESGLLDGLRNDINEAIDKIAQRYRDLGMEEAAGRTADV